MESKSPDGPKPYTFVEHVTEEEIDEILRIRDTWFEGKEDNEQEKRIMESINFLMKWTTENGAKKEPNLPENVRKITSDFSLESEGLYYRYAEDAPDPHAIWAIDIENDPAALEASSGVILRVFKDFENGVSIIDIGYESGVTKSKDLHFGISIIKRNQGSDARETINLPTRKISRLTGPELTYIDIALRSTQESLSNPARQSDTNIPPKFRSV